jgi:hypothetical protein
MNKSATSLPRKDTNNQSHVILRPKRQSGRPGQSPGAHKARIERSPRERHNSLALNAVFQPINMKG